MSEQQPPIANKRLGFTLTQVGGAIVMLVVGAISESNLQIISSKGTPDDVLTRLAVMDNMLERLDDIEAKLTPEALELAARPDRWTSLQDAQQQELTAQRFDRVAEALEDVNRALGDLRRLFLSHQVKHSDEERRGPK